jgi:hypothetical protein
VASQRPTGTRALLGLIAFGLMSIGARCQKGSAEPVPPKPSPQESEKTSDRSGEGGPSTKRGPETTHVVAAIQAQPCELTCGRLGDCLSNDEHSPMAASNIELGCLRMCSDAEAELAHQLHGCESQDACPDYVHCMATLWPTKTKPRPSSDGTPICERACDYMSCIRQMFEGQQDLMPVEQMEEIERMVEPQVEKCLQVCETGDTERELFQKCLQKPACMEQIDCVSNVVNERNPYGH